MSWAEIKKAVNSNIDKTLDVLITEKMAVIEQNINHNSDILNNKADQVLVKADGFMAVDSQNMRSEKVLNIEISIHIPDFYHFATIYTSHYGLYRLKFTGFRPLAYGGVSDISLRVVNLSGGVVGQILDKVGFPGKTSEMVVFLNKGEKYTVQGKVTSEGYYKIEKASIYFDIVKDDFFTSIHG